jgi:hypothetical protein
LINSADSDVLDLALPISDKVINAGAAECQFPQDIFDQYPYLRTFLVVMVLERCICPCLF